MTQELPSNLNDSQASGGGSLSPTDQFSQLIDNFRIVSDFVWMGTVPPLNLTSGQQEYTEAASLLAESCLAFLKDRRVQRFFGVGKWQPRMNLKVEFPYINTEDPSLDSFDDYHVRNGIILAKSNEDFHKPTLFITANAKRIGSPRPQISRLEEMANGLYPPLADNPWLVSRDSVAIEDRLDWLLAGVLPLSQLIALRDLTTADLVNNPNLFQHFLLWFDESLARAVDFIPKPKIPEIQDLTPQEKRNLTRSITLFRRANRLATQALEQLPSSKSQTKERL